MEQTNTMGAETPAVRPTFLTVLCILSFIAAGISILGLLIGMAGKGAGIDAGSMSNLEGMTPEFRATMEQAQVSFGWPNLIGSIVLTIVGLFGVIKMWKLQKQGFFIYAGAAIVGVFLPVILGASFSTFSAVLTAAFIAMYYANIKVMTK